MIAPRVTTEWTTVFLPKCSCCAAFKDPDLTHLVAGVDLFTLQSISCVPSTAHTGGLNGDKTWTQWSLIKNRWRSADSLMDLTLLGPTWMHSAFSWQPPFPCRHGLISVEDRLEAWSTHNQSRSLFSSWMGEETYRHRRVHRRWSRCYRCSLVVQAASSYRQRQDCSRRC